MLSRFVRAALDRVRLPVEVETIDCEARPGIVIVSFRSSVWRPAVRVALQAEHAAVFARDLTLAAAGAAVMREGRPQ